MYNFKKATWLIACGMFTVIFAYAQTPQQNTLTVAMSAVKGTEGKPQTVLLPASHTPLKRGDLKISGADRENFKITSISSSAMGGNATITFTPPVNFAGTMRAKLTVYNAAGKVIKGFDLNGLSTNGLEGENEPPLSSVADALGYQINVGWKGLANNTKPELLGDEIDAGLFKRAGKGKIEIIPVARYSPDFELPFGYYTNTDNGPEKHQTGVLAKAGKFPEHQTLLPGIVTGSFTADPGDSAFGLYVNSPAHTAFTEDVWNMLYFPENAVHAARIYPLKSKKGILLSDTYLVCFEGARNGSYNDFVFLIKNVKPLTDNLFTTIFDGQSLKGWHSYIKDIGVNKDPDENFKVENGMLHVKGKDLGYEISDKGFFNFHAKLEFKWGVTRWPPRQNAKRDGGFLYNIPMAEPDSIWPKSIECQIQEGDVGDFWMLGFSTLTVDGKTNRPTNHIQFVKKRDNEKPYGEWNTVEVISYKGRCVQIVNGVVVNYGDNSSIQGGRVILQSEYSEIYYRNVRIRQL